eukprot:COSAG05_NODE_591_length_8495_cov_3436.543116_6_plen_85_part_00
MKITKGMEKKKLEKRSKLKPFLKIVNYNHVMPTRCVVVCSLRGCLFLCIKCHPHAYLDPLAPLKPTDIVWRICTTSRMWSRLTS